MGNRVQSFSHQVRRVVIRWFIREGKVLADEIFSCAVVGNVDVLGLRIVD